MSEKVYNVTDVTNVRTSVDKTVRDDEKEDIGYFEKPVINQLYTGNAVKTLSLIAAPLTSLLLRIRALSSTLLSEDSFFFSFYNKIYLQIFMYFNNSNL